MTTPPDYDPLLESMNEELRSQMYALNEMHHPVYPSDPRRVAELERRIDEIKEAIVARRKELRSKEVAPQRASLDPIAEAQQTAAPAKVPG
ncbi:MAG: hypothetical protein H0W83_10660 [Planctomycetes bacterium]|nr:hypothetical protein [Planctomycetota bacterium]